MAQLILQTA